MYKKLCDKVRELLPRYREGELSKGELREVRSHLSTCEECRRELEALERLFDVTSSMDLDVPDEYFWLRFPVKLRQRIREKDKRARRAKVFVPAFGGAVLAVLILFLLWGKGNFKDEGINFEITYGSSYSYYLDQFSDNELIDVIDMVAENLEVSQDTLWEDQLAAADQQSDLLAYENLENLSNTIEEYLAESVSAETIIDELSDDEINVFLRRLEEISSG